MPENLGDAVLELGTDNSGLNKGIARGLADTKKGMGRMAASVAKHRKAIGVGMVATGAVVASALTFAVKGAIAFDTAMAEVNSLVGLTEKDFEDLSKRTLEMSSALGVDAVESAEALYQAISAGVPRQNVFEFMEVATKAGIAGVTDTETAVDGLTTVINAFGMDISDAGKVADIMFTAVKGGKTTFEELSASMFQAAPIAAAMNIRFEEVTAAVATLTSAGVPTTIAMTSMRQAMVALQKPTETMSDIITDLGFASGQALVDTHGFQGGLQLLMEGSGATREELAKAFGSVEALGAVLGLTGNQADRAGRDIEAAMNSGGSATEAFNIINERAGRQFTIMVNKLKNVGIQVGLVLLPIITKAAAKFGEIAQKVADFIEENQKLVKIVVIAAAILGPLLIVLGSILLILPGLAIAITAVGAAINFALGPVGLAIIAITALVAIGVIMWRNWSTIWPKMKSLIQTAGNFIIDVFNKMTWTQRKLISTMLEGLKAVLNVASKIPGVGGKFASMATAVDKAIEAVDRGVPSIDMMGEEWNTMSDTLDKTEAAVTDLGEEVRRTTDGNTAAVKEGVEDIGEQLDIMDDRTRESGQVMREEGERFEDSWAAQTKVVEDALAAQRMMNQNALNQKRKNRAMVDKIEADAAAATQARLEDRLEMLMEEAKREADIVNDINNSWSDFQLSLDETIAAMEQDSVSFGDVVETLADRFGISTREMGQQLAEMGVSFGDTMGLIEAVGRDTVNQVVGDFVRMAQAAKDTADNLRAGGLNSDGSAGPQSNGNISVAEAISRATRLGISLSVNELKAIANVNEHGGELTGLFGPASPVGRVLSGDVVGRNFTMIPIMGKGGIVNSPTLAMIGDDGPEAVVPLSRGGGIGGGTHITFTGNVYGLADFERTVAGILEKRDRRGARGSR